LNQGRNQFEVGTPERERIDSIPTEPAQMPPGQAEFTANSSPAAGTAAMSYKALHGTSYTVLHKGPGALEYVVVADDRVEREFTMSGLPAGVHSFKVKAHNSRGDGDESDVLAITVA
jgi:hypothetical protein